MRIALMVEYDGSQFHGWQAQPHLRTVQGVLEAALSAIAAENITIVCAGRTDTGVHATNQIIHFDSTVERVIRSWIHGTNTYLPKDVCIKWGREMPDDFHARFSATARRYRYVICNTPIRPALLRCDMTWQYRQLDDRLMQQSARFLIGEHDFTSFRSIECQSKTAIRHVRSIEVTRRGDYVIIDVTANAFLHHMVRNIAGVLMAVGAARKPVSWVEEVLLARDRRLGSETAPPYGLYLVGVTYPSQFNVFSGVGDPLLLNISSNE